MRVMMLERARGREQRATQDHRDAMRERDQAKRQVREQDKGERGAWPKQTAEPSGARKECESKKARGRRAEAGMEEELKIQPNRALTPGYRGTAAADR